MFEYMYFPEDKTEYIPSIFMLLLVVVASVLFIVIFKRISRRQLAQAKKLEEQLEIEGIQRESTSNSPN
ncbi:hypothetical protein [Bacillus solimangrovi]|uniref:Uncharacterized protein n=1 Tax=Bacillus solimangrovi TaxID=1305675 RepID=A0A1E5LIY1_9BACI|nr:hypothetical protein [Bacillus solimangrovi]OEH94021.1 hypothetical protein BFG57_10265 [Bacillus solimangrovi]